MPFIQRNGLNRFDMPFIPDGSLAFPNLILRLAADLRRIRDRFYPTLQVKRPPSKETISQTGFTPELVC